MPETLRLHMDEGAALAVPAEAREASTLAPAGVAAPPAAPPSAPPTGFGIRPSTIDEAWRYAKMLAASDLVPKDYRGKPENCMVAMQYGAEVGLPPMASLQSIAVINGRPGLFGDGFLAVIVATAAYAAHQECFLVGGEERERLTPADLTKDDTAALARFWRKGRSEPFTATFSIADAKKARLLGKEGPWTEYPSRMLKFRAREFAARDGFAAELKGVGLAEALRDAEPPTIVPIGAPQRRSLAAQPEAPAAQPEAPPLDDRTSSSAAAPSAQKTTTVIVEETCAVQAGATLHYEIEARDAETPTGHVFLTADEALYKVAASCAGTGALMVATWHRAKRPDGAGWAKFLDALAAAD